MRTVSLCLALVLIVSCASTAKIGEELAAMRVEDQEVRNRWLADQTNPVIIEEMQALSRKHVARVRQILEKYGWPTRAAFGNKAPGDAWLIAQHGGKEMLAYTLPLMEKAVKAGDLEESLYATSLDRVLVQQGKPQRYGTQFDTNGDKCEPLPIEDAEHVDERRVRAGMMPLAEYTAELCAMYKKKP
jgi:hypothetical protein